MNGIIRVFPKRTSFTPSDDYVFTGLPPLPCMIPEHKEVHISCTFTWDRAECEELAYQWEERTNKPVKIGGPAYESPTDDFIPGMYVKPNIIFTSRGCNNSCPYCRVPRVEGKLKELPIHQGNIIQDNNFLQTSKTHRNKVYDMLRTQKNICFKGGLAADLIDDHFIDNVTGLRISELWLACDTEGYLSRFKAAVSKLKKAGFNRNKIHCYALIMHTGDGTVRSRDACMGKADARLREIYHAVAMPFAMLYQGFSGKKKVYSREWARFARQWMRPAAIKAHVEQNTHYKDFST